MRKHLDNLQWFLLWSVAFYATALGYAFEAKGALVPALTSTLVAVSALTICWVAAYRGGLRT